MKTFFRKIIPAGAIFLLLFTPKISFSSFSDVPPAHMNSEAIGYFEDRGALPESPDGRFSPNEPITMGDFLFILFHSFPVNDGDPELENPNQHVVSSRSFFLGYVFSSDFSLFDDKDANVPFKEASAIIGIFLNASNETAGIPFRPSVEALGLLSAIPSSIRSFESWITRGEAVEIMYRIMSGNHSKSSLTYFSLAGMNGFASAPERLHPPDEPERIVDISLSNSGFSPSFVTLSNEEPALLRFSSVNAGGTIVLFAFDVMSPISPGESVSFLISPENPGSYEYLYLGPYCAGCEKSLRKTGTIIVD